MIGVVFAGEMRRAGRGRLAYWTRWILGAWLALLLLFTSATIISPTGRLLDSAGDSARSIVDSVTLQVIIAVLLAGPAFAAGAVTDEKVKGTLELLFLTHVGPTSIILGKLLARVVQGFVWSLTAWPVIAFVGLPGGVTPSYFATLAIVTILVLAGTCGITLLASVWARQARNAAIAVYAFIGLVAVPGILYLESIGARKPLAKFVMALDPFYALDAARDQPDYAELRRRLGTTILAWGLIAVPSTLLAIWRLRPAYFKHQQGRTPSRWFRRWGAKPPIGDRPVAWVERYTARRWPRSIGIILVFVLTSAAMYFMVKTKATWQLHEWFYMATGPAIGLCSTVAGVRALGCVTAERSRRTWETLTVTPLSFETILREKTSTIVASIWPYFFANLLPACMALSIAEIQSGWSHLDIVGWLIIAYIATVLCQFLGRAIGLGLVPFGLTMWCVAAASFSGSPAAVALLAPVMAYSQMTFLAGVGVWFSARSKNHWISLLGTVVGGFVLSFVVIFVSSPFGCLPCCVTAPIVAAFSPSAGGEPLLLMLLWGPLSMIGFAWFGHHLVAMAARYLSRHERIPAGLARMIDLDLPGGGAVKRVGEPGA